MLPESSVYGLELKIDKAMDAIHDLNGAVVALSAGVDSSLVAFLARVALGHRAVAATGLSESLPPDELEVARKTAREIGIRHMIVKTNELANPNYSSNPADRCYYCKDTLYHELRALADSLKFEAILDGTHADDLNDIRPGLRAAQEAGVLSPLLVAGFSKQDVRAAARNFGLSVWEKPAMPCLSSRISHGEEITTEKLVSVGEAESLIRRLTGVKNLRVRYQQSLARIEVAPEERRLFFNESLMNELDDALRKIGFSAVTLDLRGYAKPGRNKVDPLMLPMADRAS